jgi:metal-responsive CopG/Arc/MetJ family transcriptional regulator
VLLEEKVKIDLPVELVEKVDGIMDLLGFESREEFVEAAVRRLLDRYTVLVGGSR